MSILELKGGSDDSQHDSVILLPCFQGKWWKSTKQVKPLKWTYEQTADEETSVQTGEEASFQENLWKFCRDGESLWHLSQGFFLAPYSSSAMWRLQTAAARIIRLCLSQLPDEGLSSWEKQDMSLSHPVPGACCWGEGSSECGWEVCVSGGSYSIQPPLRMEALPWVWHA